jgi:hypothetical protein
MTSRARIFILENEGNGANSVWRLPMSKTSLISRARCDCLGFYDIRVTAQTV